MNQNQPLVSVIILNWNTLDLLAKFVPVVKQNSALPRVEIVVADNGSTDDSVQWLQQHHPDIRIIALEKNCGFVGGYNEAIAQMTSEYTVLLNSDAAPGKGWLQPLIDAISDDANIAAVVPKIKDYSNPTRFEYAGAGGGFIDRFGYPFCRGRIFDVLEEDNGQYNAGGKIFWGSGAALMVKTDLYNRTGGLDYDFFAHMEEIDWCWRVKNMGFEIIYVPQSEVFHVGGGTLPQSSPRKNYLNFRNNLFLLVKNKQGAYVLTLFCRMLLDGIALLRNLAGGEFAMAKSILLAHCDFYRQLPLFIRKRKVLQPSVTKKRHAEIYKGSIVFDFFVRGIRYFSSLTTIR
ncbi:MAG: glycosyltransferase family 2 protein [Cytophagaceae bacterium]|jgi:GT2 family glycosyltransferase|nr:glycosyltransferase family 2 protein [Cytophagaceae bacterium]